MSDEELERDIGRFLDYLKANGVSVLAFAITTGNNTSFSGGSAEMITEMCVRVQAHMLGLKCEHR